MDGVALYLWIEIGAVAAIIAIFLFQSFVLFKPEHTEHHPMRVKIGACLQGGIIGGLVGLVLLPLRLSFFVPEIPGPPQAIASTAILPAFLLLLIIRRGLLARAPIIGRYLRAYRRAALKYQIDVAEKQLARLESMDNKTRSRAAPPP